MPIEVFVSRFVFFLETLFRLLPYVLAVLAVLSGLALAFTYSTKSKKEECTWDSEQEPSPRSGR